MRVARLRMKNMALSQGVDRFAPFLAGMHIDCANENDQDLATIIDVPDISLIGPMQPNGRCASKCCYVQRVPYAAGPCAPALEWLRAEPSITYVASLAGEWDAMAMLAVADTEALTQLNDRIAKSPLIERAQSQIILKEQRSARVKG